MSLEKDDLKLSFDSLERHKSIFDKISNKAAKDSQSLFDHPNNVMAKCEEVAFAANNARTNQEKLRGLAKFLECIAGPFAPKALAKFQACVKAKSLEDCAAQDLADFQAAVSQATDEHREFTTPSDMKEIASHCDNVLSQLDERIQDGFPYYASCVTPRYCPTQWAALKKCASGGNTSKCSAEVQAAFSCLTDFETRSMTAFVVTKPKGNF